MFWEKGLFLTTLSNKPRLFSPFLIAHHELLACLLGPGESEMRLICQFKTVTTDIYNIKEES